MADVNAVDQLTPREILAKRRDAQADYGPKRRIDNQREQKKAGAQTIRNGALQRAPPAPPPDLHLPIGQDPPLKQATPPKNKGAPEARISAVPSRCSTFL